MKQGVKDKRERNKIGNIKDHGKVKNQKNQKNKRRSKESRK